MKRIEKNGLLLFQFENLARFSDISHYVSTRIGGMSEGKYKGLNLGLDSGDEPLTILNNRRLLAQTMELPLDRFVFAEQTHSKNVLIATDSYAGMGTEISATAVKNCDGFISKTKNLCINAKSADCTPVLLYDPIQKVIGAVHSGWKGTVQKIAHIAVKLMVEEFNTNPKNIVAGIGPSNGPCCYEVGDEVVEKVAKEFDTNSPFLKLNAKSKKVHFDLWKTNEYLLLESGLLKSNIETAGLCTQCNPHLFYSARRSETGRIVAGIYLK